MKVIVPAHLADHLLPRMSAHVTDVRLLPMEADGTVQGPLDEVEVLFKYYTGPSFTKTYGPERIAQILVEAPGLRWIHSGKAGVEDVLAPELVESTVVLTNGAGGPKRAIAETVLAFILADAKRLHDHFRDQQARKWNNLPHRELPGATVAILGLGRIGLEVAKLCNALDMRVIGTRRMGSGTDLPGVEDIYPPRAQSECVAQADYVVVASALTPETRGMVDAETFKAMRPDAVLINVARGAIVDEAALLEALQSGSIRGAYLDVFVQEPLPPDSPFYSLPNVVVMPHNSPFSQNLQEHMVGIFLENFRRYCAGERLLNVVDKQAGY
jgi:phosphoglycerate dehydrogenase-like enzyme